MAVRYYNELLGHFTRMMRDCDAAADIVQEAYARLFALQRTGQNISEPRALLYRMARNLVIDRHRHLEVREHTAHGPEDALDNVPAQRTTEPDAIVASSQFLRAVLATIDGLPLRCREAFILCRFDGLSHAEVSRRMGISCKAVEQHVQNAMQAIRRCRERLEAGVSHPAPALRRGNTRG